MHDPRSWHCRVVQRLLGFFWVLMLSLSVQYSAYLYFKARYHETASPFQLVELVIVPCSLYLGFWIHPQYIKKHVKRLRALILERDNDMSTKNDNSNSADLKKKKRSRSSSLSGMIAKNKLL